MNWQKIYIYVAFFSNCSLLWLYFQTTSDLEEFDKKRKEEFKEYEMEKEYEKKKHLSELSDAERKKEEARLEELKKKHADHPKLNHPVCLVFCLLICQCTWFLINQHAVVCEMKV